MHQNRDGQIEPTCVVLQGQPKSVQLESKNPLELIEAPAVPETNQVVSERSSQREFKRDYLGGRLLAKALNGLLSGSYVGYLLSRVKLSQNENLYQKLSEELAILEAKRAYSSVPAYKKFVDQRIDWQKVKKFSDLPETNKDDYIKPSWSNDKLALYVDREIPAGATWDTSTGTSGKATSWYRGPAEISHASRLLSYRARAILGKGSYSFINGFALGPWATGMTAARGVSQDPRGVTYSVGPDPDLMLQLVDESRKLSPTRQVIVGGYPPHIEILVKLARERGISLHDKGTIAVVGGEAMSELQRSRMQVQSDVTGFNHIFSFYGASDIDINIGFETPFEVALRAELTKNPALAKDLLGENFPFVPMVFHYDPLLHLIEVNDKGQLLFTELSGHRISPRIRYNLGDAGTIRKCSEVKDVLKAHGVDIGLPHTDLPFVFVWGRVDNAVTYRGANLHWENLEEALRYNQLSEKIAGFALIQYEQNERVKTDLCIQVGDENEFSFIQQHGTNILKDIITYLRKTNRDFDKQIAHVSDSEDLPQLRIYKNNSPMSEHASANPARKQKHIFLGTEAEHALAIEEGGVVFKLEEI